MAIRLGATALGLVASMPSGPGIIKEALITEIAATVPPGVATFLLTSLQSANEIIDQQKRCGTNTIQICDRLIDGSHAKIRQALPGIGIIQVIHVHDETSLEEALHIARQGVHALLLDSGNQNLTLKKLGGTGRTHNWDISRRIVAKVGIPVYLAGGLAATNIDQAIKTVRPFGVDLCSSVRSNDRLNEAKLAAFFQAVRTTSPA